MSFTDEVRNGLAPYKDQIKEILDYLLRFLRNPVESIRNLPNWEWPVLIGLFAVLSAACGILSGLLATKISLMIQGLFIFPIASGIGNFILAGFFYYTFVFFYKTEVPYKKLYTITVFSMMPFLILYIFSGLLPPINLFGFAVSAALFVVALSENTSIPRKKIMQLVGAIYALFLLFHIIQAIQIEDEKSRLKDIVNPQSIDILKKEFGSDE